MHDQLKCSANARAFSFLFEPGGPTMKILFAITQFATLRITVSMKILGLKAKECNPYDHASVTSRPRSHKG